VKKMQTAKEFEMQINQAESDKEVRLNGKVYWEVKTGNTFTIGRNCMKGVISISRSGVVIDGSNAEIEAEIEDSTGSDWGLFFIQPSARNVTLKNFTLRIRLHNPEHSTRIFSAIYNTAFGLKIENCSIEIYSDKQINLSGIYNNGNLDTHMETRADNLVISNSFVKVECLAEEYPKESTVYGFYNNLANSVSMQNTYIYAINRGDGNRQKAVGVYTNGRFGRFVGNNIKANGTHNTGKQKEQAHVFGFINEGLYSIITSNNIVGEWAGKCVGLETNGEYTKVASNKILSTHTICGRSIISNGNNTSIEGNIITSTSRNARLIQHNAESCIITGNLMEVLMAKEECRSGCGIYAVGDRTRGNLIKENIVRNVRNCGIFISPDAGLVKDNVVWSYEDTIKEAESENRRLAEKLDERNIKSIYE
jgi:hypothetical protein